MTVTAISRAPRMLKPIVIASLLVVLAGVCSYTYYHWFTTEAGLFDKETGYRTKNFRAPLTAALIGGKVITLDNLETLIQNESPVLVDVMHIDHGLKSILSLGYLGENPNRDHIPGSVWLPLMGQAKISRETEQSYQKALEELTHGNKSKPVVFYCLSDCWASWNAARRAISYGYRNVLWFKEGTDLWSDAGLPLERARPYGE